jgi:hypothetical protein
LAVAAVALAILFGLEVGAFAQVATLPPDPDPGSLLTQIIAALGAGHYLIVALLGTAVLVWLAEHFGPQVVPVLGKPVPSALVALAMSLVVPLINAAMGGALSVSTLLGALTAGFTAWGGPAKLIALITGDPPAPARVDL